MKKRILSILLAVVMAAGMLPGFAMTAGAAETDTFVLELEDSYGDSWDGARIEAYVVEDGEETLLETITMKDGFSSTVDFIVEKDAVVHFYWFGGDYPEECSFTITRSGEEESALYDGSYLKTDALFHVSPAEYYAIVPGEINEEHGWVYFGTEQAAAGTTVVLGVYPEYGYALDELTVMQDDAPVETEDMGDGYYSFVMPAGNVAVSASFRELLLYAISVTETENGSIYSVAEAAAGTTVVLEVEPDEGYALDELTVMQGENLVETEDMGDGYYSFVMPAGDVAVIASFTELLLYAIEVNPLEYGRISISEEEAPKGENVLFYVNPYSGYVLVDVTVVMEDGTPVEVTVYDGEYSFTMPDGDVAVSASFRAANNYKIEVTEPENGSLAIDRISLDKVPEGEVVSVIVTPDAGYVLDELIVKQDDTLVEVESFGGGSYIFTMPSGNVEVSASFREPICYNIHVQAENGRLENVPEEVPEGSVVVVTAIPDPGYYIRDLTVIRGDTSWMAAGGENREYSFIMPSGDVVLRPSFVENKLSVCGTRITTENASDVFGDGTVSYDADTCTLTLTDADLEYDSDAVIMADGFDSLTIVGVDTDAEGDNDIVYSGSERSVIVVEDADLTFRGTFGEMTGGAMYAVSAGSITADKDCTINRISGAGAAMYGSEFIHIAGRVNHLSGSAYGLYSYEGDVTISGTVGDIAGEYYAIYADNVEISGTTGGLNGNNCGIFAKNTLLIRETTVEAAGGTAAVIAGSMDLDGVEVIEPANCEIGTITYLEEQYNTYGTADEDGTFVPAKTVKIASAESCASADEDNDNLCDLCGAGLVEYNGGEKTCSVRKAVFAAENGTTVRLLADCTAGSSDTDMIVLDNGNTVTLDLNGYTLTAEDSMYLAVISNGMLKITDSSAAETGRLVMNGKNAVAIIEIRGEGIIDLSEYPDPEGLTITNHYSTPVGVTGYTGPAPMPICVYLPEGYAITTSIAEAGVIFTAGETGTVVIRNEIRLPETGDGNVTVDNKAPATGDRVTVTVTPDEGKEVDKVVVRDENGKEIPTTDNGDGTYTYVQPDGDVTIEVTFRDAESEDDSDKDSFALDAWYRTVMMLRRKQMMEESAKMNDTEETPPETPEEIPAADESGWQNPFEDVAETDWFFEDAAFVNENGLMIGTNAEGTQFSPDAALTRAMLVTILWRLEGQPVVNWLMQFDDVPADEWYGEAVRWAAAEGIVSGYGDGRFGTADDVTREQVMAILHRYAAYKGLDTGVIFPMIPQYDCSLWAENDILWADMIGLTDGIGADIFDMTASADRAEIAAYLRRFCEAFEEN